jgi:hypothetical protein
MPNMKIYTRILLLLPLFLPAGCYTLKGISIDPRVNTFSIDIFETVANNAPPTIGVDFTERLKDKMRSETRLQLKTQDADVLFSGKIIDFRVVPVAPKPGELVELNQLVVVIQVSAENLKDEKIEWPKEKSFSHFAEFSNQTDLLSVQDQLLQQTIYPQLLEDIFNYFFNNW